MIKGEERGIMGGKEKTRKERKSNKSHNTLKRCFEI
jgi:hypothetical protein